MSLILGQNHRTDEAIMILMILNIKLALSGLTIGQQRRVKDEIGIGSLNNIIVSTIPSMCSIPILPIARSQRTEMKFMLGIKLLAI